MTPWTLLLLVATCAPAADLSSLAGAEEDDWPQYRGPKRDDLSAEKGLLKQWPEKGPPLLWAYANAGVGYSGCAVVGSRYYTIGGRGDAEFLIALDLGKVQDGTPAEAWVARVGPLFDFNANNWSSGPSSTPTVDGDAVFALGGCGDLVSVAAASGKERWRVHLPSELGAEVNPIGGGPPKLGWGFCGSPLVDGNLLICLPGGPRGTVAALDKKTGRVVWRSAELTEQAAYTSPVAAEIDKVRQILVLTNQGLRGVAAENGRLLWKSDRRLGTEVVNSPIVQNALVFTTVGAGRGGDLVRLKREGDRFRVEELYSNRNLANHHGNVVLFEGHLYGASEQKGWICQGLESGEVVWQAERGKLPPGSVTYADGRFYIFGERDGSVTLLEASPKACNILGRFAVPKKSERRKPSGGLWTPPVVAQGKLFLRDQDLIFCYDVRAGN
jgi:outer membrane protein assembly factor BamB